MMFGFEDRLDYRAKNIESLINNFTFEIENSKCFATSWINDYKQYLINNNITIYNASHWYYILYSNYLIVCKY